MSDVTDSAFRQIIAQYGKPDVFFTEFVSVAGLCSEGKKKVLENLHYTKKEKPIVAQLWGSKPEQFYKSARLIETLGFDGIDINMGCPEKNVIKQGGGAALIKESNLAVKIIRETMRGAGHLPVSIKTRLGYNTNVIEDWIKILLAAEPAVITIHGRTRKQMSKVPADWKSITKAVKLRNQMKSRTLIIGNGDIDSLEDAKKRITLSGVDGIMVGRGVFGNPWLFNPKVDRKKLPIEKQLKVMVEHAQLFEKLYSRKKNFDVMKKHFKAYASGFDG
ncbi:tRNA-dihydrouridine synthase family protein, partial [Patescibacteria group bacterium]|nr:tRNA-dihydrouridine synthase family protein [Patescibacteria group bacterium]